jgi:hypothetical protein
MMPRKALLERLSEAALLLDSRCSRTLFCIDAEKQNGHQWRAAAAVLLL